MRRLRIVMAILLGVLVGQAWAAEPESAQDRLRESQALFHQGQYFKSARYAFDAIEKDRSLKPEGYAWISIGLARAHLYNASTYFFIKTLQEGNKPAIRRVLTETQDLLVHVGDDVLRKYLIRHTTYDDYDSVNLSAYLYSLGKDGVLSGHEDRAVGYINGMSPESPLWPFALQLRGTAFAILGRGDQALQDFRGCVSQAENTVRVAGGDPVRRKQAEREADDLKARCQAGGARTLYQMDRFAEADRAYDHIPKASFVWPDILFEQAWNSFARREYNRTLGKLVSYKSPALSFVFNSEVDVLRAQSYLALCLYSDANAVINEFNRKYATVGEEVKRFVEGNADNLYAFYDFGKEALHSSLYTKNESFRLAHRFINGPYFRNLVVGEGEIRRELGAIHQFASMERGTENYPGRGFPGFLEQVLGWREKSIRLLGGAYVKNSLMDYHSALISDFDKMSFIKLEMLKRAKEELLTKRPYVEGRGRGSVEPSRRDDQYFWSFNGEFWTDELGDYVFGLESECKASDSHRSAIGPNVREGTRVSASYFEARGTVEAWR